MSRTRKRRSRKPRPMKNGECRTAKNGIEYCKVRGKVRFRRWK